jgi:predicted AAA+ superfamily ATPase
VHQVAPEHALDALVTDPTALVTGAPSATTRSDYEQIILAGGFPLALARDPGRSRERWFRNFVSLVVERDVMEIRKVRQRQVLPQVLQRLAGQTGQVVNLGQRSYTYEDRLHVLPLDRLWTLPDGDQAPQKGAT